MAGRIYTRQGDAGQTSLGTSQRVPKDHPLVVVLGDLDELNSHLGVVRAANRQPQLDAALQQVQEELLCWGAWLAASPRARWDEAQQELTRGWVRRLEEQIDRWSAEAPLPRQFILPGGCQVAALLDLVRSVARRCERHVVRATTTAGAEGDQQHAVAVCLMGYLNRLSDWLFVAARWVNRQQGVQESPWPGVPLS